MYDEMVDKVSQLMTAAFGLVAALAWNDAIKSAIASLDIEVYGVWVYPIVVTIIAVVMTVWLGRVATKAKTLDDRLKGRIKHISHKESG